MVLRGGSVRASTSPVSGFSACVELGSLALRRRRRRRAAGAHAGACPALRPQLAVEAVHQAVSGSLLELLEHELRDGEAAQAAVFEAGAQHVAAGAGAGGVGGRRQEREGSEARLRLCRAGEHEPIGAQPHTRVSLEEVQRRVSRGHLVGSLGGRREPGVEVGTRTGLGQGKRWVSGQWVGSGSGSG